MTGTRVKKPLVRARDGHAGRTAFLLATIAILGGCAERKAHAIPWATAVMVRPNPPMARAANTPDGGDATPDIRVEPPSNAVRIFGGRPLPPRPKGGSPSGSENSNGTKEQLLVPELSPQETAVAKEQVAESILVVERNLAAARKKNLTAAQADTVSKINGFVSEAREAEGEGDWARARNLAKKAQILSQDLVASL
jgi:hypothetical protein